MKYFGILGLILCVFLPVTVIANDNEKELYRYRSKVMDAAQSHLRALQAYVKGNLAFKNHVSSHVDALLELNGMYQDLFQPGNIHPDSAALPLIWSDPRGFQQAIQNNRQKIMALKQVDPADMKTLKRAVNEVRMSCGDCHYYFRER